MTNRTWKHRGLGAMAGLCALGALSACSSTTALPTVMIMDCRSDRVEITENIDWEGVRPMRMRIVDGEYRPMVMHFEKDRPYALVVENADREAHNLWAPDFLKSAIALNSIQFGDKAPAKGCVNGVRLTPGATATLRFVPQWEGRFEVFDQPVRILPAQNAASVMHIIQPRAGLAAR
ncbi:hypothetical protein ACFL12_08205 [Pseudomonadota bacterium]